MKKIITLTLSLLFVYVFAIGQDGINYQGAATDANGDELTNQSISIRASLISGSANGNLEWEETHSTTTDQFGLFNIVIGQGTNTRNGATANFDDIDWGSGNHYLKIEMDATGGTNYAIIGTTQMMSVPYALYSKSAGIDSAAIAAILASSGAGTVNGSSNSQNLNSGATSANDICNLVDTVIEIIPSISCANLSYVKISDVEMDDSSNIYITISSYSHPNGCATGGEIRKYNSSLNLLWSKNLGSNSPQYLKYRDGHLLISGYVGYSQNSNNASGFISKIDPLNGNTLWTNSYSGAYHAFEFNNNYVCAFNYDNGRKFTTYNLLDGSILLSNWSPNPGLSSGISHLQNFNGNNMLFAKWFSHNTSWREWYQIDITTGSTQQVTNLSSSPSTDPGTFLYTNGKIFTAYYDNYSIAGSYYNNPIEGQLYSNLFNENIKIGNYSSNNLNYFQNYYKIFDSNSNGFSLILKFKNSNINIGGHAMCQNYTVVNTGTAIIDFDNNGNYLSTKNILSIDEVKYPSIGTSSSGKKAVGFSIENEICVNGNTYSGLILMIY